MAIRKIIDENDLPDCDEMFDTCKGLDRNSVISAVVERVMEDWDCENVTIGEVVRDVTKQYDEYCKRQ